MGPDMLQGAVPREAGGVDQVARITLSAPFSIRT